MDIEIPLISPISRKYYKYANENSGKMYYKVMDIRLCLEKICDEVIVHLIDSTDEKKWKKLTLHGKIILCKNFMDQDIVDRLLKVKNLGNVAAHNGEEGEYSDSDIEEALEAIKCFSLEVFYSFFVRNGYVGTSNRSWTPTVFSTLPPIYRIKILEKYYKKISSEFDVNVSDKEHVVRLTLTIDKLSMAYVKNKMSTEAHSFLEKCLLKEEINEFNYNEMVTKINLLSKDFDKLNISNNLSDARENFNKLLSIIRDEERDGFVCLVSAILNGVQSE